ncbi:MAG: pirin family protein [Candidatus Dadabacteria bacterium]|nr:pirin family protein [Candidatus Dadabacteria bacterium]
MTAKNVTRIARDTGRHWVGDGFQVSTMLSYNMGPEISPFLLLDYAGPSEFPPSDAPRGVERHPHRGFETVTIVYEGEVEHGDNAGHSGKIGRGDVQWMTAGRGILHVEKHGREFSRRGGTLEMIQLWVNLPARHKMTEPGYQEILDKDIPVVELEGGAGEIRVIAGELGGTRGPARTFTPVNVWDARLGGGKGAVFEIPDGFSAFTLVLKGGIVVNGAEEIGERELAFFTREGDTITVEADRDSTLLILAGEPIDEPVVGQGPFVMNTHEEIRRAIDDYRAGRF